MRGLGEGSFAISSLIVHFTRKFIELANSQHAIFLYFNNPLHEKLFDSSVVKHSINVNNRLLWDQIWLPHVLKKDRIEIALFMKGTIPALYHGHSAVIFHDLGYFDNVLRPYRTADTLYMKTMMPKAARDASIVFTVSEYTRNETLRIFKADPQKIKVCYQNCSPIFRPVSDQIKRDFIRNRYHLPEKFIFCPISISPRKNLSRILTAFDKVKNKITHDLVITGGQSSKENKLMNRITSGFFQRVHVLGNVPNENMPVLYSLADFTIYPSLLEGFGMPVLEAFHCDCPVLTSNITSLPEVAGDGAYMVDPYDTDQIADGIFRLATDSSLRLTLILKGREQAKKFSWERTAQIILDSMQSGNIQHQS